jgi:hypothetical protein
MPSQPLRRAIGAVLLAIAAIVGIATVRMIRDGGARFDEGRRLADAHDVYGAAAAFEDAARCYAPGSPYPARALDRLALMAKGAEMRGEQELSLHLWEVVRRSVLSARHLWQPNRDALERAERAIAKPRARRAAEAVEAVPAAARTAPPRPRDPSPFGSILLFLGLLAWIGGSAWLFAASGRPDAKHGRRIAWACAAGGTALWIVMAWFAG